MGRTHREGTLLNIVFMLTSIVYTLYIILNIQIRSHDDSWFCQNVFSKLKSVVFFLKLNVLMIFDVTNNS